MTKNKPVGLSFLNQKHKEVTKFEKHYLDVEKNQFINYYPVFAVDKQDELLLELLDTLRLCRDEKIEFLSSNEEVLKYTEFLVIKHFTTSFKNELKDKPFKIHREAFEKMYATGLLEYFINEMFDILEVQKVVDRLYNLEKLIKDLSAKKEDYRKVINEKVQNEALKIKVLKNLE